MFYKRPGRRILFTTVRHYIKAQKMKAQKMNLVLARTRTASAPLWDRSTNPMQDPFMLFDLGWDQRCLHSQQHTYT